MNGRARVASPFTDDAGIKVNVQNVAVPLELFQAIFDDEIISMIFTETNRNAGQFLEENIGSLKFRSRFKRWIETNSDEIGVFLALLLLQGVNHKPVLQQYFSKRASLLNPIFGDVMDKNLFILLRKFLHFTDNKNFDADGSTPKKLQTLAGAHSHERQVFQSVPTGN